MDLFTELNPQSGGFLFSDEEADELFMAGGGVDALDDSEFSDDDDELLASAAVVLGCTKCKSIVSCRGTSVYLLADEDKKLYSSDAVLPAVAVQTNATHSIATCECQICDMVCRFCSNQNANANKSIPLGYKVVTPCEECLNGDNNGHLHMFSSPYLEAMYTRDFDDPRLADKAILVHAFETKQNEGKEVASDGGLVDQLILYYIDNCFMTVVEEDRFHKSEAERQRVILNDIAAKKGAAEMAMVELQRMAVDAVGGGGDGTVATKDVQEFVAILNAIALCPLTACSKSEILSCCKNIKSSLSTAATTGTIGSGTIEPPKVVVAWNRDVAEALGRVIKAYKCMENHSHGGDGNGGGEDDLFWMTTFAEGSVENKEGSEDN